MPVNGQTAWFRLRDQRQKFTEVVGVSLLWGLELVAELHKVGGITGKEAEVFAQTVRRSNPKHITEKIVSRFADLIRRQEGHRSPT